MLCSGVRNAGHAAQFFFGSSVVTASSLPGWCVVLDSLTSRSFVVNRKVMFAQFDLDSFRQGLRVQSDSTLRLISAPIDCTDHTDCHAFLPPIRGKCTIA